MTNFYTDLIKEEENSIAQIKRSGSTGRTKAQKAAIQEIISLKETIIQRITTYFPNIVHASLGMDKAIGRIRPLTVGASCSFKVKFGSVKVTKTTMFTYQVETFQKHQAIARAQFDDDRDAAAEVLKIKKRINE